MRSDVLENYFKNVGRHQLLTREQEVELAQRIEKGDDLARKIMIESNLRLAISFPLMLVGGLNNLSHDT